MFVSVKSLFWNAQFYIEFFCLWVYFYHVRQQRFAGSSFSVVLGRGFQDQMVGLGNSWYLFRIGAHAMKNRAVGCFLFNFKINFIHVWTCFLRWSWLMYSSRVFVCTARPIASQSFCQEPSNQGIMIYIYIIVGLEEGILYLSSCRIPESHII